MIALLLDDLVDLVDCLVAGRASLSMKTKLLRGPVCKNQTNSKFRDKGGKFDFFHILMLHGLGYN